MKIHFFGSLGGNGDKFGCKTYYEIIVEHLIELGHKVITRNSLEKNVVDVLGNSEKEHQKYYKKMMSWIYQADIIIVEVTRPEVGVGLEIGLAVEAEKPIISLFREGQSTPVLFGKNYNKIQNYEYDVDNLKLTLKMAIEEASKMINTRFTMLMPPDLINWLNKLSKQGQNRSEYIRRLIREDIERRER